MKYEVTNVWYSTSLCNNNIGKIYVFGDNLIQKGKAGQAIIRDCSNSFGIPTKRLPSMSANAFFSDKPDEFVAVNKAIAELIVLSKTHIIVLPSTGIGTGLAKMNTKSPELYKYLVRKLEELQNET